LILNIRYFLYNDELQVLIKNSLFL